MDAGFHLYHRRIPHHDKAVVIARATAAVEAKESENAREARCLRHYPHSITLEVDRLTRKVAVVRAYVRALPVE